MHTTPGFTPAAAALGVLFMPGVLASSLVAGKGRALHFSVSGWSPVLGRWLQVCYYSTTEYAASASWYTSSASWMRGPVTAPKSPGPHTKTGVWGHFPDGATFDWKIFWTSGFV